MNKAISLLKGTFSNKFNNRWKQYIFLTLTCIIGFSILYAIDLYLENILDAFDIQIHLAGLLLTSLFISSLSIWLIKSKIHKSILFSHLAVLMVGTNLIGIIAFSILKFNFSWDAIPNTYKYAYLPILFGYSIPIIILLFINYALTIPALKFQPYFFDSLEDAIGKRFDGLTGVIWHFTNVGDDPLEYRTRLNKERLQEPLGELFKQVIAYHNYDPQMEYNIPFSLEGEPLGWRFDVVDGGLFRNKKRQLNPNKSLVKKFFFFRRTTKNQYGNIRKIRDIYVKCLIKEKATSSDKKKIEKLTA